jgi:branched-subunit amino acid transport protein
MHWFTIMGMAFVTYLARAVPLLAVQAKPPAQLERFLRYIPPAIFTALIVPGLVLPQGKFEVGGVFLTGIFGAIVAYLSRNMAITLISGLLFYALLRWVFGIS